MVTIDADVGGGEKGINVDVGGGEERDVGGKSYFVGTLFFLAVIHLNFKTIA